MVAGPQGVFMTDDRVPGTTPGVEALFMCPEPGCPVTIRELPVPECPDHKTPMVLAVDDDGRAG
jgi:hypothetical protein